MKPDSKEINEMMARCLAGECTPEEMVKLQCFLLENPDLKTDYELINLLFGKDKRGDTTSDKKRFNKIKDRLENEGLM